MWNSGKRWDIPFASNSPHTSGDKHIRKGCNSLQENTDAKMFEEKHTFWRKCMGIEPT